MPSHIKTDHKALPAFETHGGRLDRDPSDIDPAELVSGFSLVEREPSKRRRRKLHRVHAALAREMLAGSGTMPDARHIGEITRELRLRGQPRHLDGLTHPYFQVHTSGDAYFGKPGGNSVMNLHQYLVSEDEHRRLQVGERSLVNPDTNVTVHFSPVPHSGGRFTVGSAFGYREPDASWHMRGDHDTTLVFPNGYDATPGSEPGVLYVHEFEPEGEPTERYVSLSRVEAHRPQ